MFITKSQSNSSSTLKKFDKIKIEFPDVFFSRNSSVPCDYDIGPEWASNAISIAPDFCGRPYPPGFWEFYGASYWPWPSHKGRLRAERGFPVHKERYVRCEVRPRAALANPDKELTLADIKGATTQGGKPLFNNPWGKLWGSSVGNPISYHPDFGCYTKPKVTDLSYLYKSYENDACYTWRQGRGCFANAYRRTPEDGISEPQRMSERRPLVQYIDPSYGPPPHRWNKTESKPVYVPRDPDYTQLTPPEGAPPCINHYELNGNTRIKSQWTP